jgi:hypothetical protein
VVYCTRHGKEQHYAVNPEPLNQIRTDFLARFATIQTQSLKALRRTIEKPLRAEQPISRTSSTS